MMQIWEESGNKRKRRSAKETIGGILWGRLEMSSWKSGGDRKVGRASGGRGSRLA